MPRIHPFHSLRPAGSRAVLVSCPPSGEACGCCDLESQDNFRKVLDASGPAAVRDALRGLVDRGILCADSEPHLFVYRISRDGRRQVGIVASIEREHLHGDRTPAPPWSEPAIALFDDRDGAIFAMIVEDMNERPIFHFNAGDGTTHSGWLVRDTTRYVQAFEAHDHPFELILPGAESGEGRVLALLLDRASATEAIPVPRCGLFVQRMILAH